MSQLFFEEHLSHTDLVRAVTRLLPGLHRPVELFYGVLVTGNRRGGKKRIPEMPLLHD